MSAPVGRVGLHESFLVYRRYRYLKAACLLVLVAAVAYAAHSPAHAPNGGTWLGYALGGASGALVVWLAWFGIRKRTYGAGAAPLRGWLSGHVYLGLALVVVSTLHAGFQMGWNVHTLAWALVMGTVASGLAGVAVYIRYPMLLSASRLGMTVQDLLSQIGEIDRECRAVGLPLGDDVNAVLVRSSEETRVGGSFRRLISGRDPSCPTHAARLFVERLQAGGDDERIRRLHAHLVRKEELLDALRRHVRIAALLKLWLFLHIPLSVGALAAVAAHVFAVFFYW
jgi:hypothetical protein